MKAASLCALGFVVAVAPLGATRMNEIPSGETVILPDFTVKGRHELPPPESWQYAKLEDGTEVLSNASERTSRKILRDFQMFQQALALAWPELGANNTYLARTLILCGRKGKFADFAPPEATGQEIGTASRFARNREQAAIIVDLEAAELQLASADDDSTTNSTVRFEVDPDKQLYREYVRFLLSNNARRTPPWLQEGIAQIVMAMEFAPDWVKLGEIDDSADSATALPINTEDGAPNPILSVPDRSFNFALRRRALIPLEQMFAVTPDAPEANNPLGNNRWAKQAYAFVHLCLYGQEGRYKAAFGEFTKKLQTQPVSEALFKDCFKMSYYDMLFVLRSYVDVTAHRTDLFKLTPGSPRFGGAPVTMRAATLSEIGRIKGDAQRLAGRINDALTSYSDAYVRGEREPVLLAAYGIAAGETGQSERALALLEAAAQGPGTRRPGAYVELAKQRLIAARAKPAGAGGIDDAQFKAVAEPLLKARVIGVPMPEIYVVLAEAWLAAATPPKVTDFGILGEGLKQFPRELPLLHALARLYARIGENAAAGQVAQVGLRFASSPVDRARFEQLAVSPPPVPSAK